MQSPGRTVLWTPRVTLWPLERETLVCGIMLIAPLTAKKKKKIYMQAEWKEFIHKSWGLLWLKESVVLSAFYTRALEGGILADGHTRTQKL